MKTAAVLPALGIGDALLMMIASHRLAQSGYCVTTFHDNLHELSPWFPNQSFSKKPAEENLISDLKDFDLIIAENDNSPRIKQLLAAYGQHNLRSLSIFYPTYSLSKHGDANHLDQIFNPDRPMAENIGIAIGSLLNSTDTCKENGITPPSHLKHRSHPCRIIIHPTSREPWKNWTRPQFLKLAKKLKRRGYDPQFCVSPHEREDWKCVIAIGCGLPEFPSLADLAAFIYESGFHIGNDSLLGHLASNLNIPTLIIANDEKRMRLWRPGWHPGKILLPPQWLPNPRFLRWKKERWQLLVPVRSALKAFDQLAQTSSIDF